LPLPLLAAPATAPPLHPPNAAVIQPSRAKTIYPFKQLSVHSAHLMWTHLAPRPWQHSWKTLSLPPRHHLWQVPPVLAGALRAALWGHAACFWWLGSFSQTREHDSGHHPWRARFWEQTAQQQHLSHMGGRKQPAALGACQLDASSEKQPGGRQRSRACSQSVVGWRDALPLHKLRCRIGEPVASNLQQPTHHRRAPRTPSQHPLLGKCAHQCLLSALC
jgi:hypothetical protein